MIRTLPTRLEVTWTCPTDVPTAYDGSDGHRASLLTLPTVRYRGSFALLDAEIQTVEQVMATDLSGAYELPLAHEATPALVAITGTGVTVDATYCDWIAVGRRVLVVAPSGSYTAAIAAASGGSLTIDASPPATCPARTTHVYPLEPVLLDDGPTGRRWPVAAGEWSWTGRQQTDRAIGAAGATLTTFGSKVVLDRRPLGQGNGQHLGGLRWLEAGGKAESLTAWARSRLRRDGSWAIRGAADRQWAKALIAACRGRRAAFLRPTWRPDLTLYSQPAGAASSIRVVEDFAALWGGDLARQRLQLEYADGSVGYFAISTTSAGAGYTQLNLGSALPSSIPGGSVRVVSFLETVRLDDDAVTLTYNGSWTGSLELTTLTIQET